MCRNIRTLYNVEPPVSEDDIRAAALQYVRKVGGFTKPSKINEDVFNQAVADIAAATAALLDSLKTKAPPKNWEEEIAKARARSTRRFGR